MWNDKSLRLRGLVDRLHNKGQHAPTLEQAVGIILEICGCVHGRKYLIFCRKETAKLRDRFPAETLTPGQLERLAVLDARLEKKQMLINDRAAKAAEKQAAKKAAKKSTSVLEVSSDDLEARVKVWDSDNANA